jgi:putative endonuclease
MVSATQIFGQKAEQKARTYLISQGLQLIVTNYRCKYGEIDLIMLDVDVYVFVEVRCHKDEGYGNSIDSVTKSKQRRIIKAAKSYLQQEQLYDKVSCRFDVIAVQTDGTMEWIKNAFWVKW